MGFKLDWKSVAIGVVAGIFIRHLLPIKSTAFAAHADPDYGRLHNPGHPTGTGLHGLREGWENVGNPHYLSTLT